MSCCQDLVKLLVLVRIPRPLNVWPIVVLQYTAIFSSIVVSSCYLACTHCVSSRRTQAAHTPGGGDLARRVEAWYPLVKCPLRLVVHSLTTQCQFRRTHLVYGHFSIIIRPWRAETVAVCFIVITRPGRLSIWLVSSPPSNDAPIECNNHLDNQCVERSRGDRLLVSAQMAYLRSLWDETRQLFDEYAQHVYKSSCRGVLLHAGLNSVWRIEYTLSYHSLSPVYESRYLSQQRRVNTSCRLFPKDTIFSDRFS